MPNVTFIKDDPDYDYSSLYWNANGGSWVGNFDEATHFDADDLPNQLPPSATGFMEINGNQVVGIFVRYEKTHIFIKESLDFLPV